MTGGPAAPTSAISRFAGEWRFLSNFAPCPWIAVGGEIYPTVEHAYQASKTPKAHERRHIRGLRHPKHARVYGKYHLKDIRPDWDRVRVDVMRGLLAQKFSPGRQPDYLAGLLRTGDVALIEGNTHDDTFWGVCFGGGTNMLGQLLMALRTQRREEAAHGRRPEAR